MFGEKAFNKAKDDLWDSIREYHAEKESLSYERKGEDPIPNLEWRKVPQVVNPTKETLLSCTHSELGTMIVPNKDLQSLHREILGKDAWSESFARYDYSVKCKCYSDCSVTCIAEVSVIVSLEVTADFNWDLKADLNTHVEDTEQEEEEPFDSLDPGGEMDI